MEAQPPHRTQQEEKRDLNTKLSNYYFISNYISIVKNAVIELLKTPNYQQSNLRAEEKVNFC